MRDNTDKMRDSKVRRNNGRAVKAGAPSSESDFVNSVKAATEVPRSSFEFYVWSDEGVNLQVDLTSSPSDWTNWTNRFKNEVRISENVNGNQSRSLWQDLSGLGQKSSFLWNTNHCPINDRDGQPKCSSGLKLTKDGVAELEQQKKAEVSYGAPGNYISGAESCAKDTTKEILTLDAGNAPFNNSLCDSIGNSLSDPGTLKLQHSKPDNECSGNCAIPNGSCIVNPGVVCAGASSSSSEELQNSEVASCHKYTSVSPRDNGGSMDLCDPKNSSEMEQGRLVNSSKINFVTDGNNFLSKTKEMVVAKIVDGMEHSRSSKFDDPLKKSGLDSSDQVSETEFRKRRKLRPSEIEGSSGKPTTRILRSMAKTAVMVLPRRSTRLISK